jgi:hypothetical protein
MNDLKNTLKQESIGFSAIDEPQGAISLALKDEDCLVEIHPDRSMVCLFGLDLDDLRGMISGGATEDLSSDELQRVARDSLRQTIGPRAMALRRVGYEEKIQATDEYFILCYQKILEEKEEEKLLKGIRQCLNIVEGKK